jgi:uncharacterized protein YgbK (DUF1537 family)
VREGTAAVREALAGLRASGFRYAVVDALANADLTRIARAAADTGVWVAGSGLPGAISAATDPGPPPTGPDRATPAAVLVGSTSEASRQQVENFARWAPALRIDPVRMLAEPGYGHAVALRAVEHLRRAGRVIAYSCASPSEVAGAQRLRPAGEVAARVERTLADIAVRLVEAGVRRLVVAGGETSGAVLRALGVSGLTVGPTIAPGVPWMDSVEPAGLALALKSGNFGGPDFFADALGTGRD